MSLELLDFRGLMSGQVLEVDPGVVMVCHVIIFTENIVGTVHNSCGIDDLNVVSLCVELQEAVETDVDQGQEIGHAEKRLQVDVEEERK
jgi:hypothetical protein